MRGWQWVVLTVFLMFGSSVGKPLHAGDSAAYVLHNAQIVTPQTLQHETPESKHFAQAMAWSADGRIVAVGSNKAVLAAHPEAQKTDVGGAYVLPGLIDAHGHLLSLGQSLMRADLVGASNKAEVLARLQAFEKKLGQDDWLLGRGWDQNDWPEKVFPTAADLDQAFPNRPVYLTRVDGHAAWANTAAMKLAGRSLDGDWQPQGGEIIRTKGKATGVLIDGAMGLVSKHVPPASRKVTKQALKQAAAVAVSKGLTGVHDAGVSLSTLQLMADMADEKALPLRVYAMANGDRAALDALCLYGHYQHPSKRLSMRSVKLFADGALGSRGAALLEPYSDAPEKKGLWVTSPERLNEIFAKAKRCNIQVMTHAIGDRANRAVLDGYAKALRDSKDHRWRVEHAQVLSPKDIERFAPLGVIASMQPTHATSDMPWAEARLGKERVKHAYAWQSLLNANAKLAFGSDFPVEHVDPLLGLFAAVNRTDLAGSPSGGWQPKQRVSLSFAIRGFTELAAYAGFAEHEVGQLAPNMQADFIVVAQNPWAMDPKKLHQLTINATYVGGERVYSAND